MEDVVSRASQGFLGLPAELRNWIYELCLLPTLQRIEHAWAHPPPSTRFDPLFALALVNRQVSAEVTSLFYQSFAPHICLYFNDQYRLHDFYQWAMRRANLQRLKICLRAYCELPSQYDGASFRLLDEHHDRYSQWSMDRDRYHRPMALMYAQPGFQSEQVIRTFYHHPSHGLIPRRPPKCDVSTEFGIFRTTHPPSSSANHADASSCHLSVLYPPLQRSLRFTFHNCFPQQNYYCAEHRATIEMEGELRDLDLSTFSTADHQYHQYRHAQNFRPRSCWWRYWSDDENTEREVSEPDSWQATEDEASDDGLGDEDEEDEM